MKKRKFFSFMLMGLLTLGATSMVTSCKDYDDDINNLQDEQASLTSQINTLQSTLSSVQSAAASHATTTQLEAVQSQVTSQGTQLNSLASQVTTAISNAESASAAATAAQTAVDALKTQVESIDLSGFATKDELANYVTATALNEQLETFKSEIQSANKEQLDEIKANVAKYDSAINTLYTAVTSVSLVGSFDSNNLYQADNLSQLSLTTGKIVGLAHNNKGRVISSYNGSTLLTTDDGLDAADWTFGVTDPDNKSGYTTRNAQDNTLYQHNATPTQTFKYGENIEDTKGLLIRVSPTNASISKENVKLIDSQGNELTDVKITDVQPYKGTLTRAGSNGGLWKVTLALDPNANLVAHNSGNQNNNVKNKHNGSVVPGTYIESTLSKDGNYNYPKLYAIAVNNTLNADTTLAGSDSRNVVSSYDVGFAKTTEYTRTDNLDAVKVYPKSEGENSTSATTLEDAKGYGGTAGNAGSGSNIVQVQNGEKFVVEFKHDATASTADGLDKVAYFYVDLDRNYAGGDNSDQSEGIAWDSYSYDGLQKIVPVEDGKGSAEVSVTMSNAVQGDDVAFRVFAVNYDGTYTVIGGKPFVVHVGAKASTTDVASAQIEVTSINPNDNVSPWYQISGLKNGAQLYTTGTGTAAVWSAQQEFKVGDDVVKFKYQTAKEIDDDNTVKTEAEKNSDIKYIRFMLDSDPSAWTDGSTATGTIDGISTAGLRENTINVSIKKVLPTKAEVVAGLQYDHKTNQFESDGSYVAFMIPNNGTSSPSANWTGSATYGYKDFVSAALNFAPKTGYSFLKVGMVFADAAYEDPSHTNNNYDTKDLEAQTITSTSGSTTSYRLDTYVDKDFIAAATADGKQYNTTLSYNFGYISSEKKVDGTLKPYTVEFDSFKTTFYCPLGADFNTYAWGTYAKTANGNIVATNDANAQTNSDGDVITYTETPNVVYSNGMTIDLKVGTVANTSRLEVLRDVANVSNLLTTYLPARGTVASDNVTVTTDGKSGVTAQEYYTGSISGGVLTLTKKADSSVPHGNVNSHINITTTDAFGHDVVISLPFIVKEN